MQQARWGQGSRARKGLGQQAFQKKLREAAREGKKKCVTVSDGRGVGRRARAQERWRDRLSETDEFSHSYAAPVIAGWMEGVLRRLHVKPSVIHEAVTAVKLGLVSPTTLENVAKRASVLALEADVPLEPPPPGEPQAEEGTQVWQPFPSAAGDPGQHALTWKKVPVTTLPKLQPLPGTEKMHNFSAGEHFMQFDGGMYRVLNTTGEILPGAIELPTNGSGWKLQVTSRLRSKGKIERMALTTTFLATNLQDISVLQGREPDATESEIDDTPAEETEPTSSVSSTSC